MFDGERIGDTRSWRADHRAGGWAPAAAVYFERNFVAAVGLMSYRPEILDQSARGVVRRWHPKEREARGHAGAGADHIELGITSRPLRR